MNSRKWTESTGSFLSMNEMQKGGEIPEGGAKDETENVRTQEREEDDGERVREKGGLMREELTPAFSPEWCGGSARSAQSRCVWAAFLLIPRLHVSAYCARTDVWNAGPPSDAFMGRMQSFCIGSFGL